MANMNKILSLFALLLPSLLFGQMAVEGSAAGVGSASVVATPVTEQAPAMGWNSWLYLYDVVAGQNLSGSTWKPTEAYIHQQSDALKANLGSYGYNMLSVDGGWGNRDGNGNIQAVPAQFPSGAAALGAYIHANGQRFGLYGTPAGGCLNSGNTGTTYAEQYQHEYADAAAMVSWGVDYFKSDLCSGTVVFNTDAQLQSELKYFFSQFKGRSVSFLVNAYYPVTQYNFNPNSLGWYGAVGASYLRIGGDLDVPGKPWWTKTNDYNWSTFAPYQGKGRYLDPDNLMLQLLEYYPGENGSSPPSHTVGDVEGRTQFNWYSMMSFPLLFGYPPSMLSAYSLQTLSNPEVIAVDQDALGKMATQVSTTQCGSSGDQTCQVWVKKTTSGYAVLLMNLDRSATHSISVTWSQAGLSGTFNMRDAWAHTSLGASSSGYTANNIPAMGSVIITLTQ